MKLKNKLILIFILFACFVIFNNSDCFATFDNSTIEFAINDCITIISNDSSYDSFILYNYDPANNKNSYISAIVFSSSGSIPFLSSNTVNCSIEPYSTFNYCYKEFKLNGNTNIISTSTSSYVDNNTSQYGAFHRTSYNINYNRYTYHIVNSSSTYDSALNILVCTSDVFKGSYSTNYNPNNFTSVVFEKNYTIEPETTKHDLFQLNLTDKNFNNALHTFTLNTDENFVNYSELTDLIENNNKYCLYVTDYTRLLTFSDNSFNATLESSSYLLSGYIDFLVSDNAYFYFSPHYNRIKVCSGDYRGQDMSTYTKRFFFNLVYSDDSDDTYFTILDDNGLLWSLSDYTNDGISSQSDYITDIQNSYFIGSNQTIYYANEDTNYILDSLTDSIYYGKDRGADERIYNFCFSGGNKKEFYLNEATFDDNVATQNQIITEKSPVVSSVETFQPVIIHDESSGNSSVIPQDTTTYTYPANTVTDDTTSEEDATHRQNERTSYTSTDSYDDTSNWSLWDFIKGIFGKIGNLISSIVNLVNDLISGLINLVIPTTQQWDNLKNDYSVLGDTIQSHLPFVSFIRTTFEDAQNTVVSPFDFLNITMPSFSFFGGNTEETNYVNVRDAYEPYRIQIRSWLVLIVYGVAFVYIVKHVSDYGATQYANAVLEALQSGNRLGRGKGD